MGPSAEGGRSAQAAHIVLQSHGGDSWTCAICRGGRHLTQDRFVLNSPYDGIDGLQALKGMWHSHLAKDEFGPDRVREICRQGGYDFLGITDHDNRYPLLPWSEGDWRRVSGDGFLVIRGFEATHPIGHITCLGLEPAQVGVDAEAARRNRDERADLDAGYEGFLERASRGGAFLALNHPHRWRGEAGALMSQPGLQRGIRRRALPGGHPRGIEGLTLLRIHRPSVDKPAGRHGQAGGRGPGL